MSTVISSTRLVRKLNMISAGIATSNPKAVVMSASEIPAETEARPPAPEAAIS